MTQNSEALQTVGKPTKSLKELISDGKHTAIETEINRAMEEKDAASRVLFAVNTLEATLKHYLETAQLAFAERATLAELWKIVSQDMNVRPKNIEDARIKRLAASFFTIVESLGHLRNQKSSAHGRTNEQIKAYRLQSRHGKLCVHASHTMCVYILDVITDSRE